MRYELRNFLLFLFNHRFLAIARWEMHFLWLRCRNFLKRQNGRIRKDIARRDRPLFLNLGCGPRGVGDRHWVNVDGYRDRSVEYLIDIGRRLPFEDGTFAGVFCEHVLEHFSFGEGVAIAAEVHRVLQPGGSFRVIVPDAERIIRLYIDSPAELLAKRGTGDETPIEIVNAYFRQRYEHQFLYDWVAIDKMLRQAGFVQTARASFGHGEFCPQLILDDGKYEWESLYVEAQRS